MLCFKNCNFVVKTCTQSRNKTLHRKTFNTVVHLMCFVQNGRWTMPVLMRKIWKHIFYWVTDMTDVLSGMKKNILKYNILLYSIILYCTAHYTNTVHYSTVNLKNSKNKLFTHQQQKSFQLATFLSDCLYLLWKLSHWGVYNKTGSEG